MGIDNAGRGSVLSPMRFCTKPNDDYKVMAWNLVSVIGYNDSKQIMNKTEAFYLKYKAKQINYLRVLLVNQCQKTYLYMPMSYEIIKRALSYLL